MSPNQGLLFFAIPSGVIFYLLVLRVAGTLGWDRHGRRHRLSSVRWLTIDQLNSGELKPGQFKGRVGVTGRAVPGPAGEVMVPLRARHSAVACAVEAWHLIEGQNAVQDRTASCQIRPDLTGIGDGTGVILVTERLLGRGLLWMEPGAADPFTLVANTRPEHPMQVGQPDRRGLDDVIAAGWLRDRPSLHNRPPYWVKVRALKAGTPLTAVGRLAERNGGIVLDRTQGTPCGVTTATPEQAIERFARLAREGAGFRRFITAIAALIVIMLVASIFAR